MRIEVSEDVVKQLIAEGWLGAGIQGDKIFIRRDDVGRAVQDMLEAWAGA